MILNDMLVPFTDEESFTAKVRLNVAKIPKGKVASYAAVAVASGNARAVRAVGNILHKNKDSIAVPCHRVVNSCGRLAPGFGMGGPMIQKQRLEAEGVPVFERGDGLYVDINAYGYFFSDE